MDMNPPESAPRDRTSELRLSAQQQDLLDEALSLLIDVRSHALDIAAQVCRRQGGAVPDVHDFQLPAIIDLQRRLAAACAPPDATMSHSSSQAAVTVLPGIPRRSSKRAARISLPVDA
ncbi:hypothetical protein [Burkholderia ambifaria]|uniref:hypothetical protein n=1 Tax=Burkholderia ambifaria TaxID=152480 RepID=UPI001589C5BE|nr:hypothetical protein [Burkholderia ambifaria]WDR88750.1 hypothetical protein OR986_23085 [Burkholderia ambifaria]WDS01519.1 hypothetical protein OR985_28090 [Burkholderia ambifaria]